MLGVWGSLSASSAVVIIFGWLGAVSSWILFLSPLSTFARVLKEKSVSHFDHLPYVVSVANCLLWVSYGVVTPNRLQPLVTNAVGGVLELAYCAIYITYTKKSGCVSHLSLSFACVAVIDIFAIFFSKKLGFPSIAGTSRTSSVIGLAAALLNTLMYGAPLNAARRVLATKSVEFMPPGLMIGGFLSSATWTVYAVSVGDLMVFIPNFLGDLLALAQFAIYASYGPSLFGKSAFVMHTDTLLAPRRFSGDEQAVADGDGTSTSQDGLTSSLLENDSEASRRVSQG